jgi:hypothetical protein
MSAAAVEASELPRLASARCSASAWRSCSISPGVMDEKRTASGAAVSRVSSATDSVAGRLSSTGMIVIRTS